MLNQTLEFLESCGLKVKRNGRDYLATINGFPEMQVVFQRQEDIVNGVANGMLDFGIAGFDLISELPDDPKSIVTLNQKLGFGYCSLELAVPEQWPVATVKDLKRKEPYRVASKFPRLTRQFLESNGVPFEFVKGAGTLEVSPALGNADFIVDLVSTGRTLDDNRLKRLKDGMILTSEAALFANRKQLGNEASLTVAKRLLEYFVATMRARDYVSLYANMRGDPDKVVPRLFSSDIARGLEGPTISPVVTKNGDDWFAIHLVIQRAMLSEIIEVLRSVGGSGVVVAPTMYIFEEEPREYQELLDELNGGNEN